MFENVRKCSKQKTRKIVQFEANNDFFNDNFQWIKKMLYGKTESSLKPSSSSLNFFVNQLYHPRLMMWSQYEIISSNHAEWRDGRTSFRNFLIERWDENSPNKLSLYNQIVTGWIQSRQLAQVCCVVAVIGNYKLPFLCDQSFIQILADPFLFSSVCAANCKSILAVP